MASSSDGTTALFPRTLEEQPVSNQIESFDGTSSNPCGAWNRRQAKAATVRLVNLRYGISWGQEALHLGGSASLRRSGKESQPRSLTAAPGLASLEEEEDNRPEGRQLLRSSKEEGASRQEGAAPTSSAAGPGSGLGGSSRPAGRRHSVLAVLAQLGESGGGLQQTPRTNSNNSSSSNNNKSHGLAAGASAWSPGCLPAGVRALGALAAAVLSVVLEAGRRHGMLDSSFSGFLKVRTAAADGAAGASSGWQEYLVLWLLPLVLVWLAGWQLGVLVTRNWHKLPLPVVVDGSTFAVLSAVRSGLSGFCGPAACAALLAVETAGLLGPQLPANPASAAAGDQQLDSNVGRPGTNSHPWSPTLRDAAMLLLLARLLRACQVAAELWYSSRILLAQEAELWQNARERWVLTGLLKSLDSLLDKRDSLLEAEPVGLASRLSRPELDEKAPMAFERACAELITSGSPDGELWQVLEAVAIDQEDEDQEEQDQGEDSDTSSDDVSPPNPHLSRTEAGSDAVWLYTNKPASCSLEGVAAGARELFKRLADARGPSSGGRGRLSYGVLREFLPQSGEAEAFRFWLMLQTLDGAAAAAAPMRMQRSMSEPADEQPSGGGGKKSREKLKRGLTRGLKRSSSSGGLETTVGKDAFVELVMSTYAESRRLVSTVGEHSAIFALFGSVLKVLRGGVVGMACLLRFAPPVWLQTLSWTLSSVVLAISFAWGPVLLEVLQSLVLLLHIRPFDTGDKVVFRGDPMHVVQIRMLNTVFHNAFNEEVYIRNAVIYAEAGGLINLRRSGPASVAVELLLPANSVTWGRIKDLASFARIHTTTRPQAWHEGVTCGILPSLQGQAGVIVAMEVLPSVVAVRWRVSARHQLSKLHAAQVRADATRFLAELLEESKRLGVEWPACSAAPPGEVRVE
ncbi:unnamed protein product [Polarella glacialis]|uniref:Mechanosensitive ion channel protein n=1 Tax=Polarella glacialis TaxID=89957 RepID=A0A813F2E2_POLGL|nr:unnamed protein product [Polarella glacialis]